MIFLGKNGLIARGWRYYRRHGWARSMKMLRRKITGNAPVATSKYLDGFRDAVPRHGAVIDYGKSKSEPVLANNPFSRSVAIIGDTNLPQCKKYRIIQKLEAFEGMGLRADYSFWGDVPRALSLLQTASVVIFYRMQENDEFNAYFAEARRLGIPIGYDIDDPIFDKKVYGSNVNLSFLKESETAGLLAATDSYRRAMGRCDFVIVSTPGMKELAVKSSRNVFIWRNAVDAEAMHWSAVAGRERVPRPAGEVVIGYSSGSRAHEADFRVIEKALLAVLKGHPNVKLRVMGHLELPESFEPFAARIEERPLAGYGDYVRGISDVDINLVPLVDDGFNHCKSAIRYLDAAVVSVPTVAARVGDFVNVVADGETGLLAASEEDWTRHITLLVEDESYRRTMGAKAYQAVTTTSAIATEAAGLEPRLRRILLEGVL